MIAKDYKQAAVDLLQRIIADGRGMWRFRWIGLAIAWVVSLLLWLLVLTMPPVYHASARIFVDTENAIKPLLRDIAISSNIMDEITLVTNEIRSRPNLAEVARRTNLDDQAKTDAQVEQLLASLQQRITVTGSSANIYTIQFQDSNREKAVAVVQALVDTFVNRSLGGNRQDQSSAQEFLQAQIAEYERRLVDAEERLANFKRGNVAYMPDTGGDYFARLQGAQIELQKTSDELRVAERRQSELQRQLAGEEPVFGIMPPVATNGDVNSSTSRQIRQLETQVENLRLQYTDKHPRIGQLLETIEMLKRQNVQGVDSGSEVINPLDINPVYQNMRIQLSAVEVEIAALRAKRDQQQSEVSRLRDQVDTIPQVEAELNGLNRDYGVIRAKYEQLLQQLEKANIGQEVDKSIDGVQFQIVEPTFAETKPIGPHRPLFIAAGFVFAIGCAVVSAFGLNVLQSTFFGALSITRLTGLPVIGVVSLFRSSTDRRRNIVSNMALGMTAFMLLLTLVLLIMYAEEGSMLIRSYKGTA